MSYLKTFLTFVFSAIFAMGVGSFFGFLIGGLVVRLSGLEANDNWVVLPSLFSSFIFFFLFNRVTSLKRLSILLSVAIFLFTFWFIVSATP